MASPNGGYSALQEMMLLATITRLGQRARQQRQSQRPERELSAEERKWQECLKVGDMCDAKDKWGRWHISQVAEVEKDRVQVLHMEACTNHWYPMYSTKLAKPYTGAKQEEQSTSSWFPSEDVAQNGFSVGVPSQSKAKKKARKKTATTSTSTDKGIRSETGSVFSGNPFGSTETTENQIRTDSQPAFFGGGAETNNDWPSDTTSAFGTKGEEEKKDEGFDKGFDQGFAPESKTRDTGTDPMPFGDSNGWNFGGSEGQADNGSSGWNFGADDGKTVQSSENVKETKSGAVKKESNTGKSLASEFGKLDISKPTNENQAAKVVEGKEGKTETPQNEKWRTQLEVSDMVDTLYETLLTSCWTLATVQSIEGDTLKIRYLQLGEEYDQTISRFSEKLAKFGTHTFSKGGDSSSLPSPGVNDNFYGMEGAFSGGNSTSVQTGNDPISSFMPSDSVQTSKKKFRKINTAEAAGTAGRGRPGSRAYKNPGLRDVDDDRNPMSKEDRLKGTVDLIRMLLPHINADTSNPAKVLVDEKKTSKEEFKFRDELVKGDFVDATDQDGKWYLAEIKEVKHKVSENKINGEDQLLLKFTEWSEQWNIWTPRYSTCLCKPFTKSKSRQEQDTFNGLAEINPIDYSKVSTKRKSTCISLQPAPSKVTRDCGGRFFRLRMPMDNSCLFHCFSYACEGKLPSTLENAATQRARVAEVVDRDPKFCKATGFSREEYCRFIKRKDRWGGAVEISILCKYFDCEVIAFDIEGPVAYQFTKQDNPTDSKEKGRKFDVPECKEEKVNAKAPIGRKKQTTKRVFFVYYGSHYDVLVYIDNTTRRVQEFFDCDDDLAVFMAKQHVELLHIARFKKDCDKQVDWKVHGEHLPSAAPVLGRMRSNPTHDRTNIVGSLPAPLPTLSRSKSQGDPNSNVKTEVNLN